MPKPSYKTNDPKGWHGDPSRGAALGRTERIGDSEYSGKLWLSLVRLDSGGYDPNGTYFGSGDPLYWFASADGTIDGVTRAKTRELALEQVRERYPNATFFKGRARQHMPRRPEPSSYTAGETPPEVITTRAEGQCPDGFTMTITSRAEWRALAAAWNLGIDAHLEALTERSRADAVTGKVSIHPSELKTLVRRLWEAQTEEAHSLRAAIVASLGIEEI